VWLVPEYSSLPSELLSRRDGRSWSGAACCLGWLLCSCAVAFLKEQLGDCLNLISANFLFCFISGCSEVTLAMIIKHLHVRSTFFFICLAVALLLACVQMISNDFFPPSILM